MKKLQTLPLLLGALLPGLAIAAEVPSKAPATPAATAPSSKTKASVDELPGSFRADDTLATLQARFGAAQVKVEELGGAEGETAPGLVIFGSDPSRRIEVFMHDMDKRQGIDTLRVSGNTSRWHIDNGIKLGMSLADLVALNGKPITFSGLDWDYGGGIIDWNGGKLAQPENTPIFRSVTLTELGSAGDGDYPMGDNQFRSDDPKFPRQGKLLGVGELSVSFVHKSD